MLGGERRLRASGLTAAVRPSVSASAGMASFYEFFAGGGMVRAGLGPGWTCLFANDIDDRKGAAYRANWDGGRELVVDDIRALSVADMPGVPDLVWGSFPCQDLSLAGAGAGLTGARSGTFYAFWDKVHGLAADGRAPRLVAVENVCGTLTSRGGADFQAVCRTFSEADYRFGALVINADLFVPQSRSRLFVIGVRKGVNLPAGLVTPAPDDLFHPRALRHAVAGLSSPIADDSLWWHVPPPPARTIGLSDLIEDTPTDVGWLTDAETSALLDMMSLVNRSKVEAAKASGRRTVGGVYRRTRVDGGGRKVQRAEIRFDDVSGCLRTPAGGSSRQTILVVEGQRVRSRLISARETARLMGLDDDYVLPTRYNDAYRLTGDGVVVPVVRHLERHLFAPLLDQGPLTRAA